MRMRKKLLESNMADDFDSDHEEQDIDFRRLRETHEKTGFKEGLQAGEEASLQEGFNRGFADISVALTSFGQLRGAASALLSLVDNQESSALVIKDVLSLVKEVEELEKAALLKAMATGFQPNVPQDKSTHVSTECGCGKTIAERHCCKTDLSALDAGSNDQITDTNSREDADIQSKSIRNLWTTLNELIVRAGINLSQEELDSAQIYVHH